MRLISARDGDRKFIELLDTLDSASVVRTDSDQTVELEKWRATMVQASTIVETAQERVVTNLIQVVAFPQKISFFEYDGPNTKIASALADTGIPHAMFDRIIVSFARYISPTAGIARGVHADPAGAFAFRRFH